MNAKLPLVVLGLILSMPSSAAIEPPGSEGSVNYHVKCNNYNPLRSAWFGDTHVHTRYSLDASTQDTRTTPEQAYRFAQGEELGVQPWSDDGKAQRSQQLQRPLDFAMVTDHAELIGEVAMCQTPSIEGYSSWQCWVYRSWPRAAFFMFNAVGSRGGRLGMCGDDGENCKQAGVGPWQDMQEAAEQAYDRSENCQFTSFVAYEWTGVSQNVANLHRNVIFRNTQVPVLPISYVDGPSARQLWDGLDRECVDKNNGCDVLVIPHNSNLSDAQMFTNSRDDGTPITAEDAAQTARFETLVGVMQHKGSSECFFGFGSTEDELCAFEQLPYDKFSGKFQKWTREAPAPNDGYLREVMRDGFREQQRLGVNPFKWGFIASTDTHLGTPGAVEESDFLGHGGAGTPAGDTVSLPDDLEFNPGGLAVLYAEENTRDSLFAAMRRREAYGTSGPRMNVRFFASWNYPADMCEQTDFVARGYDGGVPMGGDIAAPADTVQSPAFAIQAVKDPGTVKTPGNDLQRIQVIKGWVDAEGHSQEKIYEVAGDPNNGASVDLNSCKTQGSGFRQLCTVWHDPQFDASLNAYYYARVVENPSCRWSQHICSAQKVDCSQPKTIKNGLEACCAAEHLPSIQERAWTSPIWYSVDENADVPVSAIEQPLAAKAESGADGAPAVDPIEAGF
ncbi:MAG: DUF3604 domain-containing protein [Halieaceae bacterium]|nr:DUF3604 domain-containing protein [Halieaceae bacterium]